MFYKLKTKLIEKNIAKKNVSNPFNYESAESYELSKDASKWINNSYYFSAHGGDKSFFCRLGIRINQLETSFVILDGDDKYCLKEELFEVGNSPLKVVKENDKWIISFFGEVIHNDKEKVSFTFKGEFVSTNKYLDFTSDMPPIRMAKAIGQEKWNKSFFKELENVSGQTHYEQVGNLNISYEVKDNKTEFILPCVRDHSFGKRDWSYMNNHLWLMAVSSKGQFNYSLVSYPAISVLEVGNYIKDNKTNYLVSADLDLNKIATGDNINEISLNVKLDNGEVINVVANIIDTTVYHFQGDEYTLIENIATYKINNETFKGILEIGFNKEKTRIFNSRNIGKFKR